MKIMFSYLSLAFAALMLSCQPVAPDNTQPSGDPSTPGDNTGGDDPAVVVPEKTGDEFSYITVEYRRKSNGAYPYG